MNILRPLPTVLLVAIGSGCPSPLPELGQGDSSGTTQTPLDPSNDETTGGDPTSGAATGTGDCGDECELPNCGDGVREGDEECDLGRENGTGDFCRDNCLNNVCGDGYLAEGELCDDGNRIDDDACSNDCGPPNCGDGVRQDNEECDDGRDNGLNGACLPSCAMASCGDQNIQTGVEVCDTSELGGASCANMDGMFDGGDLACARDCMSFDTSGCFRCGDGVLDEHPDSEEQCDDEDVGGQSCAEFAPKGIAIIDGELGCTPSCEFDTTDCAFCGNGVREGSEECDGADFGGDTCLDFGHEQGTLVCNASCQIDSNDCSTCGDGVVTVNEQCDGSDFRGATCGDVGLADGEPTCDSCVLDYSGCFECGNGNIEGPEVCDDTDLNGETCMSFSSAFGGGDLACDADCMGFDVSNCCRTGGQFCSGNGECCSGSCTISSCAFLR